MIPNFREQELLPEKVDLAKPEVELSKKHQNKFIKQVVYNGK